MAIPQSVIAQGEKSEQLLREANADPEKVAEAENDQPRPTESTVDWEQRYNVLQGKYNGEVPKLNRQVQDLQELNGRLQLDLERANTKVSELEQQAAETTLVNENQSAELDKYFESLSEQGYPDEFIEAMRGIASANTGADVNGLKKRLDDVSGTVETLQSKTTEQEQTTAQQAEARFWEKFNDGAPKNWEKINDDPQFLAWLEEVDPASGVSKRQLLAHARANLDVNRTLYFFKQWDEIANNAPADPGPELTPKEGGGDATPLSTGRTWSKAEITAFYDDVKRGKYRGRAEEQQRTEQDIFAAQKEGRIN
jgi:hypothetical protein